MYPLFCFGLNRGEIITIIREKVNDSDTVNSRWSDAILIPNINEAELEFIRRTRAQKSQYYITTTTSAKEYTLPSDWLNSNRVSYAIIPLTSSTTNYKKLEYWTMAGLDEKYSNWENGDLGSPTRYYYRGQSIGLYPAPSTSYDGENYLKIDYNAKSSTMTGNTDIPYDDISYLYPYHKAIVWYVCHLCMIDTGNLDLANYFMGLFEKMVQECKEEGNNMPDRAGGFSVK